MGIPSYPKGDLRRMLMVLGALSETDMTLVQLALRTGLDKKTVSDVMHKARDQAGVKIDKNESTYHLADLGPVFKKTGTTLALRGQLNGCLAD